MSAFNVQISAKVLPMVNGANNRRARRAFAGKHGAMVRNLQKALLYMERADARAITAATKNGVPPVTYTSLGGVSVQASIDVLKARCTSAKAFKA